MRRARGEDMRFILGQEVDLQPTRVRSARVRSASQLGLGRSVRVRSARGGRLAPPSIYRGPS